MTHKPAPGDSTASAYSDIKDIFSDYQKVGEDFKQAVLGVAETVGSDELRDDIASNLVDGVWPDPEYVRLLGEIEPRAGSMILEQARVIQKTRHERELAEIRSLNNPITMLAFTVKGMVRAVRNFRLPGREY